MNHPMSVMMMTQATTRTQPFVFVDPQSAQIFALACRVAASSIPVLIAGPTGSGKEILARVVHEASPQAQGPFIAVNCAAIPATLAESLFFGHEKGAFTGATGTRKGVFELAHRGTLFLDEIAEMEPPLQTRLLRVLEERTVTRVGGSRAIAVDVRVVAATNRNLPERIRNGQFREDLFYRLNVFPLLVPPLRERTDDILPLADLFLTEFLARTPGKSCHFSPQARQVLIAYPWPGNVRELRNLMERTVLLHPGGEIGAKDLALQAPEALSDGTERGIQSLAEMERDYILRVYRQADGNKTQTADLLGINRLTLRRKLKEYDVE